MFLRYQVWQDVVTIAGEIQTSWVNEFRVPYECVDVRLRLFGYGWKPNVEDENIPVLYEGVYKCYYRKVGDTDWTMFARTVVERASTDDAFVYRDVIVDTGYLEKDVYDIRVEAIRGSEFEAWGGAIEGISKGGRFWYGLEMRADKPLELYGEEVVSVVEASYFGKNPIDVFVWIDFAVIDYAYDGFIGYQIEPTEAIINVFEAVAFFSNTYRQVIDVVHVTEYIEFWSSIIHLFGNYENVAIEEVSVLGFNIWWFYMYENINVAETPTIDFYWIYFILDNVQNISVAEWSVVGFTLLHINVYQSIAIYEWADYVWRINQFDVLSVRENPARADVTSWLIDDECSGTIGSWTQVFKTGTGYFEENPLGNFHIGFSGTSGSSQSVVEKRSFTGSRMLDIEYRVKFGGAVGSGNKSLALRLNDDNGDYIFEASFLDFGSGWLMLSVDSISSNVLFLSSDTWYQMRWRFVITDDGGSVEISINGVRIATHYNYNWNSAMLSTPFWVLLTASAAANSYFYSYWDYIRVKKIEIGNSNIVFRSESISVTELVGMGIV
jgi:hypothetical protein